MQPASPRGLPFAPTELDLRTLQQRSSSGGGPRPHSPAGRPVSWAQFVAVGLGPPAARAHGPAATVALRAYRALGFVVLGVVVVMLVGYVATSLFYMVDRSWVVPAVIAPTDEHVLALETELLVRQTDRDRVAAELAIAEREVTKEQQFQRELAAAIEADLAARKAALARVRTLATDAKSTRTRISSTNRAFAAQHSAKLAREYQAGLADRRRMIEGKLQLAQISGSTLALAEKQATLDTQVDELEAAIAGTSYDRLTIKRTYDASKLALAKALDTRAMLDANLRRQQALIDSLERSAYLRAVRDRASVAVVPFENLGRASKGAPLFACRAAMVLCRRVGHIADVLTGEVNVRHPYREKQLRGRMILLQLDEPEAARNEVLFAGGAPLWL